MSAHHTILFTRRPPQQHRGCAGSGRARNSVSARLNRCARSARRMGNPHRPGAARRRGLPIDTDGNETMSEGGELFQRPNQRRHRRRQIPGQGMGVTWLKVPYGAWCIQTARAPSWATTRWPGLRQRRQVTHRRNHARTASRPLKRELAVLRGFAASRGDDDCVQEAEIDLHRLQHIESAALLAPRTAVDDSATTTRCRRRSKRCAMPPGQRRAAQRHRGCDRRRIRSRPPAWRGLVGRAKRMNHDRLPPLPPASSSNASTTEQRNHSRRQISHPIAHCAKPIYTGGSNA